VVKVKDTPESVKVAVCWSVPLSATQTLQSGSDNPVLSSAGTLESAEAAMLRLDISNLYVVICQLSFCVFMYTVNIHVSELLISSAQINSASAEIWKQSVIVMNDSAMHQATVGFVINQQVMNIDYKQINQIYGIKHALPECPVYCGGPVRTDRATILHTADYQNPKTVYINKHCAITFNDRLFKDIRNGKGPRQWKVMVGMCQWKDGQLDAELMREGGWLTHPWSKQVWGHYKKKDKLWKRLIENQTAKQADEFLETVFGR